MRCHLPAAELPLSAITSVSGIINRFSTTMHIARPTAALPGPTTCTAIG